MIADRLGPFAQFKMASDRVIHRSLEFTQVGSLGRNATATGGFVPRSDKVSRLRALFDHDENLIHTSQYRPATAFGVATVPSEFEFSPGAQLG